jgi:hypothetical protein
MRPRPKTIATGNTMDTLPEFEIQGIYDDEGNRIEPSSIPKPSLCTKCSVDISTHPIEAIVCTLTRLDHMICEQPFEFHCGNFTPRGAHGGRPS